MSDNRRHRIDVLIVSAMSGLMKNDSSQAMQNLFSAYGDDETEADDSKMDVEFSDEEEIVHRSQPNDEQKSKQLLESPGSTKSEAKKEEKFEEPEETKPKLSRKATRLVSYAPDDMDGEGEEEENQEDVDENMFIGNGINSSAMVSGGNQMTSEELRDSLSNSIRHSFTEEDVDIPPEPKGKCSMRVQDKIEKMYQQVLHSGKDMNAAIQRRKEFRNPSIYDKLIEYCSIDEKGTNYPPELFNPMIWGEDSTYEVLAQIQHAEMEKRTKKDKATVERVQGTKKPATSTAASPDQKRKTKWDPNSANSSASAKTK